MRTQEDIFIQMQMRVIAFEQATAIVQPMLEEHPPKPQAGVANIFTTGYTVTEIEQRLDHTFRVADWLLEDVS